MLSEAVIGRLIEARHAEKAQALFYRGLSAEAERLGIDADIEALNGLLADEQHHLSRLMARLVESGVTVPEPHIETPRCTYSEWRPHARARERQEIERYEQLLAESLDEATATTISSNLATERQHEAHLGGKYTIAWDDAGN